MSTGVRDKYHVAINSKGYILRGAPGKTSYVRGILSSQISRMSVSDLAYSDFSGQGLFYLAQIDWSAGFKDEKPWSDDAKYYYSTNIDAYSQSGALKLELELVENNEFSQNIYCGCSGSVNSSSSEYVGTDDDASGYPQVYYWDGDSWEAISATTFGTGQNLISNLICHKENLWASIVGAGNTWVLGSYDGSSWTDHSGAIATAGSLSAISSSRAACEYAGILYVLAEDVTNSKIALVSTVDAGANWVGESSISNCDGLPIAVCGFNSKIYYLVYDSPEMDLRCFDPATDTDISVRKFTGVSASSYGVNNLLRVFQNRLVITIPDKIYYIDINDNFVEIYSRNSVKSSISSWLAVGRISSGCIESDNRLIWGNLIYDGECFFNHKRPNGDSASQSLFPIYSDSNGKIRYLNHSDRKHLWENDTTYKTTIANNYLICNEMAPVQSIDKILDSVTILFEKMASGDSIQIYYSIDERATWVDVGTRSYSSSDRTTKKEFKIPGNVIFNKIWFRIHLDGSATTPVLTGMVMAYRPMPNYKNQWIMLLNMSDEVKLLNGQTEQREGYELQSELWKEKMVKQRVIFEDINYAETYLTAAMGSTATSAAIKNGSRLPRQGRIRAVSGTVVEEMYYSSANQTSIKGITRAANGTTARSYSSGQVVDNGYYVYVDDIESQINFTDDSKTESISKVTLIEA